ncbi:MAG: hypothetical protein J5820_04430 [Rhodocyclaceae bacterium]|nr:hypothetical protein [Rhodocyclaceae bacterium]
MEKTDSTNPIYVFMDFDGVTHPWGGVEDFRCLPLIEDVLRRHEEARIIISSDWRVLFAMPKLVARFSPDLRERVIGGSPHLVPKNGMELRGLREKEAMLWLAQHVSDVDAALWCAIDDAPGNWLTRERLVLTDFKTGFTEEDAGIFDRILTGLKTNPQPVRKVANSRRSVLERDADEF